MAAPCSRPKPSVLLIEEEDSLRRLLAARLEASFDLVLAKDGVEGVRAYDRHSSDISAVVTALEMPRLEGDLVVDWIRRADRQLPIILTTARPIDINLEILLRDPAIELLRKPYEPGELEILLKRSMNGNGH